MSYSTTALHLALRNQLLTVTGLPARALESQDYTPSAGTPYVTETLAPATATLEGGRTLGGFLTVTGLYVVTWFANADTGLDLSTDADRVVTAFPPGLTLITTDGNGVTVRRDVAPWRGQIRPAPDPAWVYCPITIPYLLTTRLAAA